MTYEERYWREIAILGATLTGLLIVVILAMLPAEAPAPAPAATPTPAPRPTLLYVVVQSERSIQYQVGEGIEVARTIGWPQLPLPRDVCVALGPPLPGETTPVAMLHPRKDCGDRS